MFLLHDFYPLWAAGRIVLTGGNPYDDQQIIAQLLNEGVPLEFYPGGFHNPPWSIWLFAFFGFFPLAIAKILWLSFLIVATIYAVSKSLKLVARLTNRPVFEQKRDLVIALLCFAPLVKLFLVGQSTILPLCGFLFMLTELFERRYFSAGVLLSLTMLKPHLFPALYFFLVIMGIRKEAWLFFAGWGTAFAMQIIGSLLISSTIFHGFIAYNLNFYAERSVGLQVTLGHVLANVFHWTPLVMLTTLIGLSAAAVATIFIERDSEYWMICMVILGLIFAPYAWSHDHVLLLLPYLIIVNRLFISKPQITLVLLASFSVATFLYASGELKSREQIMLIWPLAVLLLWWKYPHKLSPVSVPADRAS